MIYYVTCITKFPTHSDPRHRITHVGTTTARFSKITSKKWSAAEMISAIDSGSTTVYCTDRRGDFVEVVTAPHQGGKYLKTKNDSIMQDNLLLQPDC